MSAIAFLGLGAMGARMVPHLIRAGHEVTVWNRSVAATQPLAQLGATVGSTPAQAVEKADIVITMVRDDQASRDVWLDAESGAANAMKGSAIAIDCSTLTPGWVNELAGTLAEKGIAFVDAPVAGSRAPAEAAKLIFLVGCDANTFQTIEPVLAAMGSSVNHLGPVSSGTKVKLAINVLNSVQIAAISELLGFLQKSAVDLPRAMKTIALTPSCSPAVELAGNAILSNNYAPSFPIELVDKDLGYANIAAQTVDADVPLSQLTKTLFADAMDAGFGDDNISGIAQLYVNNDNQIKK